MTADLLRHLGPSWLLRRGWHAFARSSGLLALRSPARPWPAWGPSAAEGEAFARAWLASAPRLPVTRLPREFVAPLLESWAIEAGHPLSAESAALAHGRFRAFSDRLADLGDPPAWSRDVISGADGGSARHWSRLGDAGSVDVKGVWEVSRFGWSAALVRARLLDGDDRHAELFWRLFEHWAAANPPNVGPQWMCGQEAALRLIAVAFAVQAFRDSPATTHARVRLAARLAEVTARRILADFGYALSQRNNHGVSGAVGLITAGTLWPGLRDAARWRAQGWEALGRLLDDLVAADGGFSQHSTNYPRLLLRLLSWAEVVERSCGRTLPRPVRLRALAATRFLRALVEPDGTAHRVGADDGADLLPLSGCRYDDFRPALGTALALFAGERLPAGPWDEDALLLVGPCPPHAPVAVPLASDFPASGMTVLRNGRGAASFRAPVAFRHRPSQADQLHVSILWDGEWITDDVGTGSYRAGHPFGGLAHARHHSSVTVDDADPMRRVGRFLWLPWTACVRRDPAGGVGAWRADRSGFRCERRLLRLPQGFVVIDRVTGPRDAEVTLRWQGRARAGLARLRTVCSLPSRESWVTAAPDGEGWRSDRYGAFVRSWVRRLTARGRDVVFVTAVGCDVELLEDGVLIDGSRHPLPAPR